MLTMVTHRWQTPQRPSRVVILGGSGFVGRSVKEHLESQGFKVAAVSSSDLDLCQPGAVEKLSELIQPDDALVFAAAITPDKGKDFETYRKNLLMGEHVCQFFFKGGRCRQVIYISSDAMYGERVENPVRESSQGQSPNWHGLMHRHREQWLQQIVPPAVVLTMLRPCALYGPGDTHNSYGPNRFLQSAVHERKITLFGEGEELRDHVYIGDLCRLIELSLLHRSDGKLNVATGHAVSFADVAKRAAALCPEPVRIDPSPRHTPVTHRHFDITELVRAFPTFRMTPLEEGLAVTYRALLCREPATAVKT
ncbi:MAG: NAD(P)-dependent oxidoreductase [Candidatus Omnitrophica bacterium]|nr:NAD(P)-dependent oxidoreductase [Candidatus Omnitrophota bacterium]